jgi:Arc/MetJ-type ribon-helix-helix transcriptional regulator
MKISVSLPQEDVAFVDQYVVRSEAESRSAAIHAAIELLRAADLEAEYAEAFEEWDGGADARLWERAAGDGLTADASR